MADTPEPMPAPVRGARAVPAVHAFAWYREAMRLWKRGPATFAVLALATMAVEFTLNLIPSGGVLLAPSPFEVWFPSLAHSASDIDRTVEVAHEAFAAVKR